MLKNATMLSNHPNPCTTVLIELVPPVLLGKASTIEYSADFSSSSALLADSGRSFFSGVMGAGFLVSPQTVDDHCQSFSNMLQIRDHNFGFNIKHLKRQPALREPWMKEIGKGIQKIDQRSWTRDTNQSTPYSRKTKIIKLRKSQLATVQENGAETDPMNHLRKQTEFGNTGSMEPSPIVRSDPCACTITETRESGDQTGEVDEIILNMLSCEHRHLPFPNYMDSVQHDIDKYMRAIMIDWLVEVAEEYRLSSKNLYLSANYVDRYLSTIPIRREDLQLLGVACMLVASKHESASSPPIEEFAKITDNSYSADQVRKMETSILRALKFNLSAVTPNCFLQRLAALMGLDLKLQHLSEYLAEITLQEISFIQFRPSLIAVSAVILALHTLRVPCAADHLQRIFAEWKIDPSEVDACLRAMRQTHLRINDGRRTLLASFDKYSHDRFSSVSLLRPEERAPQAFGWIGLLP